MKKGNLPSALTLTDKLVHLPSLPGVYLMKDREGSILYVGKAKSLKARVMSYFQKLQDVQQKTRLMVSKIADLETIVTQTEKEALILENNLIKKYRPRFNVTFRDDKNYPYLKLSIKELYPNLTIVRQARKDGSLYFGPFASAKAVRETLRLIHQIFPIRKCYGKQLKKSRPCIYFQLAQCPGLCCQDVDPKEYRKIVRNVQLFLQGRAREVLTLLKKKMEQEARALKFEQAAHTRNRITAIEKTLEKQTMVNLDFIDRDVFSFFREGTRMEIVILFIRSGRMSGNRNISLHKLQLSDVEIFTSFLIQYYDEGKFIPREIIVPITLPDKEVMAEWLSEKKGESVKIVSPKSGPKSNLLGMAKQNAEILFHGKEALQRSSVDVLTDLQKRCHLKNFPARIQCFDISNIMGTSAVGSLVQFEEGVPDKAGYRRFRIKTVAQADDYAMMYEVLSRHLKKAKTAGTVPDLMMVDGGKGQLGVLLRVLKEQGVQNVDALSLAKGSENVRAKGKEEEKIFLARIKDPLILPHNSPVLFLLQRIRNEAHRFAISYHKNLKMRKDFTSPLQEIAGIGSKTVRSVLTHLGSIERARKATLEELAKLPSLNRKRATMLYNFFHADKNIPSLDQGSS